MESLFYHDRTFSNLLQSDITSFTEEQKARFPENETLRMDLHCHDHNSDVPDEILGRILNVPETWTPTKTVIETLKRNGCNAFTITNHNNARSCYEWQSKGFDILTGAEFSCTVPDFQVGIHVLAYGFTPHQEAKLNKLRKNVYAFQEYAIANAIPTVWAHPLYHYSPKSIPGMAFFNKMSLVFERFEVINGQRDTWQNLLVKTWIENLTPEQLDSHAQIAGINPYNYCNDPYSKHMTGGSDSHMGIFTGQSGTLLHVPDLEKRVKSTSMSALALEAIKEGRTAPYGSHNNNEKLNIAFLDYVCQIAINYKDPGLLRLLLHKGNTQDKVLSLLISNAFAELKRHKTTMSFVEIFHQAFTGNTPNKMKRILVSKAYKPVFDEAIHIAKAKNERPDTADDTFSKSIQTISDELNKLLWKRTSKKFEKHKFDNEVVQLSFNQILEKFELPLHFSSYLEPASRNDKKGKKSSNKTNLLKLMDGLSFPFLASSLLLAANFTSLKVLYNARPMLDEFADELEKYKHPKRMLWLTDTFEDKNGVSMVLQSMLSHIQQNDLPIDLLVCSESLPSQPNLFVLKPQTSFMLPFYTQQPIRIPSIDKINKIFQLGEYDRVISSTELPMGAVALFLKHAYTVPTYFYMHTDWMTYGRKALKLDQLSLSRLKRILRSYYQLFDGVFVLNKDHRKWLTGDQMNIAPDKVHLTAHWVDNAFSNATTNNKPINQSKTKGPTIIYAGRLSKEKGVLELPEIVAKIKKTHPDLHFLVAGTGPEEQPLKKLMPDAEFLGWVDKNELPAVYSACDLLFLPSKFDTFSCVVLEAMSCGLPVIAYKLKGPKDIIRDGKNGYLAKTQSDFSIQAIHYLGNPKLHLPMRRAAIKRAREYNAKDIMTQLLIDTGLSPI